MKTLELKKLDIKELDEQSLISTNGGIIFYPVVIWGFIIGVGALCAFSGLTAAFMPIISGVRRGNKLLPSD